MMKRLRKITGWQCAALTSAVFGLAFLLLASAAFWQSAQAQQATDEETNSFEQREERQTTEGDAVASPQVINATSYPFSTATGVALENMTGSTQLLGANQDEAASAVTTIGFSFNFDGTIYNNFSANSNGLMRLGTTAVSNTGVNFLESASDNPKITAYWDDLCTNATGKVHKRLVGSAPNRKLVVEFENMILYDSGIGNCSAADPVGTYQVWLTEGTNRIDFVYGAIAANMIMGDYSTGIASSPTSLASVDTTANTVTYGAPGIDTNTAAIVAGRRYSFTPVAMTGSGTLGFSSATYDQAESLSITITVNRAGGTTGAISVDVSNAGGSATGGAACGGAVDFTNFNQTLNFANGEASRTFTIQLCADNLSEGAETVNLTLANPTGGATLGMPNAATLSITDAATQFTNTNDITINDNAPAAPYPSTITVAGAPTIITAVRVTLFDFTHTYTDDVDVLLVGPGGQTFVLMEDAGGNNELIGTDITFADSGVLLPDETAITSGSYEPANYITPVTNFPSPAPFAPYNEPGATLHGIEFGGAVTLNSVFGGTNPNGAWNLYVRDDTSGDVGTISGWGLQLVLGPTAASVDIGGRVVTAAGRGIAGARVTLTEQDGTTRTVLTNPFGQYRFNELAAGQSVIVSVYSKRYRFGIPAHAFNLTEETLNVDFVTLK